ncbi:diaminopimelate epimerase [Streptomyces jumonjinensis]|uniref:diaminopimelate epimerase n=1 Tax=Streptomyces jumonjinensis TaxID=1945 RepID=UPI0037B7654A
MKFRKLHGAGNDFVVLDSNRTPQRDWPGLAKEICHRHKGAGADGLVITSLASTDPAVIEVACFNADGSMATMCGNALRCAAWCAEQDHGLKKMTLNMAGVGHEAIIADDGIWVTADVGAVEMRRLTAMHNGRPFHFDAAHTGTEHVVAVISDLETIDTEVVGRLVRHHPRLAPLGTNVNFVQGVGRHALRIRTYERGVEAETLSCGSGAVAAVAVATQRGVISVGEVTVHNRAGTPLRVRPHDEHPGRRFWIGGPVNKSYEGKGDWS